MESDAVLDFKSNCNKLESGKTTERRAAAVRVCQLLERSDVLACLDEGSGGMTWDRLLALVRQYVLKEADPSVSKARGGVGSKATISNVAKRQDAVKLFRQVIRHADRYGPRLNCKEMFHHVLTIFKDEELCKTIGADYASILLRDLLPVRRYYCEVTTNMWCEILSKVTGFLHRPPPGFSSDVLARLLHLVCERVSIQCGYNLKIIQTVTPFFNKVFENLSDHMSILGDVVGAFNSIAITSAMNLRGYLCRLGEGTWSKLLVSLKKAHPAHRDTLLQFLLIQLRAHHPLGCHRDDSGGWAANERLWKKNLTGLFEWLLFELDSDSRRLKKKESGQRPLFIILMADVFYQVMLYHQDAEEAAGGHVEARGTVPSWNLICEMLSVNPVPWLQLAVSLLEIFPVSISDEAILPTLEHLHALQTDSKKAEPMLWTVRCLTALVPIARASSCSASCSSVWKKVWSSAWRSVSVHRAEEQCFQLLTVIIEHKLIEPDYEPWQVFCSEGSCSPSQSAVGFLAAYLQNYELPDNLQVRMGFSLPAEAHSAEPPEPGSAEDVQATYPLRFHLMQWLLSGFGSVPTSQVTHVISSTFAPTTVSHGTVKTEGRRVSPHLLATVLVALAHRSPCSCSSLWNLIQKHLVKSKRLSVLEEDSSGSVEDLEMFLADLHEIEMNYLQSTFDKAPFKVVKDHIEEDVSGKYTNAFVSSLQVYLCMTLVQMCETVRSTSDNEASTVSNRDRLNGVTSRLERECRLISLATHIIRQLVLSGSMTVDDISDSPLLVRLSMMSVNIAQGLNDAVLVEADIDVRYRTAGRVLSCLQPAFSCLTAPLGLPVSNMPLIVGICQLFRDGFALDKLVEQLVQISLNQWPQSHSLPSDSLATPLRSNSSRSLTGSPGLPHKSAINLDATFDEDDEFDGQAVGTGGVTDMSSRVPGANKETYILHGSLLSAHNRLAIQATHILCNWASTCFLANSSGTSSPAAHLSGSLPLSGFALSDSDEMTTANAACRHLFAWLAREEPDFSIPWEIQQTVAIIREFSSSSARLSSAIVGVFLDGLRNIMSTYRRDQLVSAEVLRLLTLIVPHLNSLGSGQALGSDHRLCCHLLAAFWGLYEDSMLSSAVKLELVAFVEALLKADPDLKWTEIKIKRKKEVPGSIRLDSALCRLLHDSDHSVRMFSIPVLPRLFQIPTMAIAWPRVPLPSAMRKKRQHDLPLYAAWDTCLAAVSRDQHFVTFEMVEEALTSTCDQLPDDLPNEINEDEGVNRVCSILAAAGQVAVCSQVCEKQALFYIFRRSVDDEEAIPCKVLQLIQQLLGYSSLTTYLTEHTEYLLHHWSKKNLKLDKYPFKLYCLDTVQDFHRLFTSELTLHFLVSNDEEGLSNLGQSLGSDWQQLAESHIGKFTMLTLPRFAPSAADRASVDPEEHEESQAALRADEFLRQKLTKEVVDQLFTRQIDEFIVQLLLHVHISPNQSGDVATFSSSTDPEPNPPVYNVAQAKGTLDYMAKFHQGDSPTLLACLSRYRDCVQRIMLALRLKIYNSHQSFHRRRYFLLYAIFAEMIFRQAAASQAPVRTFLLRDIIHTAVHILQQVPAFKANAATRLLTGARRCQLLLVGACCHLLTVVCRPAVTSCVDELGKYLRLIVSSLLPHANPATLAGKKALALLDFLIRTSASPRLSESVAKLDPLPDSSAFQRMREAQQDLVDGIQPSLASEFKRFLSAGISSCVHSRQDGVRHLRTMLLDADAHCDLKLLVSRNPALAGHTSNGTETLIMRLIGYLKRLCEGSAVVDKEVGSSSRSQSGFHSSLQLEIAQCLGQLSTPDLHTVAMVTGGDDEDHTVCDQFKENTTEYCMAVILHRLSGLLADVNIDVVFAASTCLKAILATQPGRNFLATYEATSLGSLVAYLEPFRPGRGKQKPSAALGSQLSGQQLLSALDDDDLWLPWSSQPSVSHTRWICNLTCALLRHGGIVDEVLLCLRPICQIKVEMAEAVLPFLVHHMLLQGGAQTTVLSRHMCRFFAHCSRSFASPTSSVMNSFAQSDTQSTSFALHTLPGVSISSSHSSSGQSAVLPPTPSMKTMLDTLAFLRAQPKHMRSSSRHAQPTVWDNNFWLDLDFFEVATTAQACQAPFTALLYIQIACDQQRRKCKGAPAPDGALVIDDVPEAGSAGNAFTVPMSSFLPSANRSLLLKAYTSIGEMDSLYSVSSDPLGNAQTRLCTYMQEGEWHKAIGTYNMQLMENGPAGLGTAGLLQCLQQLGLEHVSSVYFDGLLARNPDEASQVAEFQYQAAWRSMQWDLPRTSRQRQRTTGYHQSLHSCLRWLQSKELSSVDTALSEMRIGVINQLSRACLESTRSVYPILANLQSLVEVEEVSEVLRGKLSLQLLGERWKSRQSLMTEDFSTVEPILALRSSLLHVVSEQPNFSPPSLVAHGVQPGPAAVPGGGQSLILSMLSETMECTARLAREAGQLQISERVLFSLRRLHQGASKVKFVSTSHEWLWKLEYCRLFWARNEHRSALQMLRQLTDQLDKQQGASESAAVLFPQVLCQYGQWLADTHNASPTTIMQDYMEKAVELMQCISDKAPAAAMEAFFAVARFADKQYTLYVQQMSSTEEEDQEQAIKKRVAELDQLNSASGRQEREVKHYMRVLQQQKETDSGYLQRFREARNRFLLSSLKNYIRCLQAGDTYDLRIFRLISLWFDNLLDKDVDMLMANELPRLQSRKLLPLIYQLAARISCQPTEGTQFQRTITLVLEKLCIDHPHHSLYVILALRNADAGTAKAAVSAQPPPAKRLKRQTSSQPAVVDDVGTDKIMAARAIVQRVASKRPTLVDSMCRLCEAYNELAYFNTQHLRGKNVSTQDIAANFKINSLVKLTEVAVTAINIEVDPSCQYKNLVTIDNFDKYYTFCGGINMPKRIGCLGSDGVRRQLLIKGQDDLRQDAVMQQVFEMVNQWLQRSATTKKRQLRMRTYKVIPLSQRSGVVQWCVDTIPLGQYLVVGEQSAHRRYYPTSPSSAKCREAITNAGSNPTARLKAYQEITKKFLPVFRYFFLENYPDPAQWFEHSLVYTRSAATSSIVGYIMGLGDRHCQNILIDRGTAEVIHIDLGVAFEQGKALPTPETIPFRLTRDIVDGMGLAGTEGVFRRCCEATLQLMKTSREELSTIVQVLLYDPLYQWTVSPVKARKLQADGAATPQGTQTSNGQQLSSATSSAMESSSSRKMAEHVLKRLQQKLQGIEEEGVALSVSGQVAHLIQEATDDANLCRVFPGWQPWV